MTTEKEEQFNNILKHFEGYPSEAYGVIYRTKWGCCAVFRILPGLCQGLILRFLFTTTKTISKFEMKKHLNGADFDRIINTLLSLHIFIEERKGGDHYSFNELFLTQFKKSIFEGTKPNCEMKIVDDERKGALLQQALLSESLKKFEEFLQNYLLNANEETRNGIATRLLTELELIRDNQITEKGYKFLFQETKTQVWILILGILGLSVRNVKINPLFYTFFEMTFLKENTVYDANKLSITKQFGNKPLILLNEMGIVVYDDTEKVLVPTPLLFFLKSSPTVVDEKVIKPKTITETNYSVFLYTESEFQFKIYSLFIQFNLRLTNFCIGKLTHESVKKAFSRGINAKMLENFLDTKNLPPIVKKQIELWEIELNRFSTKQGILFELPNKLMYDTEKMNAEKGKYLICCDDPSRKLILKECEATKNLERKLRK